MTTIKLKVSEKALDKVLSLLSHFSSDEVLIVKDDSFEQNKKYAQSQHQNLQSENPKLISLSEASKKLDKVIANYDR